MPWFKVVCAKKVYGHFVIEAEDATAANILANEALDRGNPPDDLHEDDWGWTAEKAIPCTSTRRSRPS